MECPPYLVQMMQFSFIMALARVIHCCDTSLKRVEGEERDGPCDWICDYSSYETYSLINVSLEVKFNEPLRVIMGMID